MGCAFSSHHSASPQAWYSFAVRKVLLRLSYRDADGLLESWKLFLCTFADFTFLGKRRKKSSRVRSESLTGGKTAKFWARPITFLQYLISKNNSYS
jgi:hypothetical protein